MSASGIFNDPQPPRLGLHKYEIVIYRDREVVEVYRTDAEDMVSRIEIMAEECVEYMKRLYPDSAYGINKLY
jgi:hypothetical protein